MDECWLACFLLSERFFFCRSDIFYPGDTVKSTVQTAEKGVDASLLGTVRRIYATQGVGGFYRGFGITMLRAAPANAAVFFTYETIAKALTKREEGEEGGGA